MIDELTINFNFLNAKRGNMNCPICKDDSNTVLIKKQEFKDYITDHKFLLFRCRICGCAITYKNESQEVVDYYGPTYYSRKTGKFIPWIEKLFKLNHKRSARRLFHLFKPKKVLDVGCGRGYLLKQLKQIGTQVWGIESVHAAEWIVNNQKINLVTVSSNQRWPFESEFFDLVIFWHVLEHMPDPEHALQEALRVLKHNKVLCISIPNVESMQSRLSLSTWFHLDMPRHLFHFNKNSIDKWFSRRKHHIISVRSGNFIQNLYGWFQSLANLFTPEHSNALYLFLQGNIKLSIDKKRALLVQVFTVIIWLPAGLVAYAIEELSGRSGTITFYVKKQKNKLFGSSDERES